MREPLRFILPPNRLRRCSSFNGSAVQQINPAWTLHLVDDEFFERRHFMHSASDNGFNDEGLT